MSTIINYARAHPHLALAAAIIVLAGCSWLTARLIIWWRHRPAAYPVQQYTAPRCRCCDKKLVEVDPDDAPMCWDCGLYANESSTGCDNPEHKDAEANQLIAEWQCVCAETSSRNCPIHQNTEVSTSLPLDAWNWQDDPDLIVWDAKQQADRCWQILYVEFPRLRRELGIAA